MKKEQLENIVISYGFVPEVSVCSDRKWKFDFASTSLRVAIELEGGIYISGRHSRGAGYKKDCVKYNFAALSGWRVIRFTYDMSEEYIRAVLDMIVREEYSDIIATYGLKDKKNA